MLSLLFIQMRLYNLEFVTTWVWGFKNITSGCVQYVFKGL